MAASTSGLSHYPFTVVFGGFESPCRHQTLILDWSIDGLPLRLCEVEPPSRLEETEGARARCRHGCGRTYGNKVAREKPKILPSKDSLLLYEEEGRARRRLILQLSFQIMIIVKESNTKLQRLKVASVKTVLVIINAVAPIGLVGREGRDTPTDHRRVSLC